MINKLKVSIITVVFNRVETIASAIKSVQIQEYPNISHVIVDGGSTDGTMERIKELQSANQIVNSEPDQGIYDALNKGIKIADGDIVGLVHSDDFFSDELVISDVVSNILFGNLDTSGNDIALTFDVTPTDNAATIPNVSVDLLMSFITFFMLTLLRNRLDFCYRNK